MTEKQIHEYYCFDRFIQVVDTKYEQELLKIEQDYYKNKINEEQFNELWNNIIKKLKKDTKK